MAKSKSELADSLALELADSLNKKFKNTGYQTAFFLDGDTKAPSEVRGWVGSGSSMLDLAISNRKEGGFPVGRITEITGLEASGKSLLAAHALANCQKEGGLAVYIDTENAVSREFLEAIGLDLEKMLYVPLETIEDIFEAIESIVESIRKSNKDRLVTIVVDSVMGASTKIEMAKEYDKDGYATSKAIILSKGMRKLTNMIGREKICLIFTNQLRTRLGVAFGDPYTPLKTIDYDIYFESGIDNYGGWLNVMKQFKLVGTAGAWYSFKRADGTDVKFLSKDFEKKLEEVDGLKDEIYAGICEAYILKYKPGEDIGIDDVEIDEEFVSEEG